MTQKGWECPRCGEVYGPQVKKCENPDCKKKPKAETGEEELGEEISGDDLHDQLYRESIQFPSSKSSKRRGGSGGGSEGSGGLW